MWWESSYHLSEKNIVAIAKNNRTGEFIPFADPDEGKTIEFTREGKGVTTDYTGFKFVDREPIPDEVLDQAVCLDDYIQILSYDELKSVLGVSNNTHRNSSPKSAEVDEDELPFDKGSDRDEQKEPEQPSRRQRRETLEEKDDTPKLEEAPAPEERPTRLRRRRE